MTPLEIACAQMAASAYFQNTNPTNRIAPPAGAVPLPGEFGYKVLTGAQGLLIGFEASAFAYDNSIRHGPYGCRLVLGRPGCKCS